MFEIHSNLKFFFSHNFDFELGQDKNAAFEFEFPNADGDFVKSEQAQQREQDRQQRSEERLSPRKVDTPETDMDRLTRHLQQRQRQLDEEDRIFDGDQFDDFDQDRFSAYPDTHADTLNSPGKSIAPSYAGLLGRDSMETEQLSQLREITEHAMRQASLIQERLSVEGSPRSRHHMAPSPPPIPFPKNIPPRHRQHKAKSSAPSVIAQAVEGLPSGLGSLPLMEQDELHMAYPAEAGEFSLPLASVHASDISFGLGGMPDESRRSSGLGQQGTNTFSLFTFASKNEIVKSRPIRNLKIASEIVKLRAEIAKIRSSFDFLQNV